MSLTAHIRTDHPIVSECWAGSESGCDPVERALEFVQQFEYVSKPGVTPLDQVLQERRGNCLALSALFCSLLRGCPLDKVEAYVAMGQVRGFAHEGAHAWTFLTAGPGRVRMIDPAGWGSALKAAAEIRDQYRIYVVFHESAYTFGDQWTELFA